MPELTIYADVQIAKQRKAHLTLSDDEKSSIWHRSIVEAMLNLLDNGHDTFRIQDPAGCLVVHVMQVDPSEDQG